MPYRDDAKAMRDRVELLESERDQALSTLERTRASLASLVADMAGLPADADIPWRSVHGGEPIRVRFVNRLERKVELRWVSYDGRERLETTLIGGGEWEVTTHVAHLWRFVDIESQKVLMQRYVRAEDEPRIVLED
jgi:hypothetical protein